LESNKPRHYKLILSFLKVNRTSLMLMIFGFTLVTMIFSSSIAFIDLYKPTFSFNYISGQRGDNNDFAFSSSISFEDFLDNNDNILSEIITASNLSYAFTSILANNFGDNSTHQINTNVNIPTFSFYNGQNHSINLINVDDEALSQLFSYSFEINNSIEVNEGAILVIESNFAKYYPNDASILNESQIILFDNFAELPTKNTTIDFCAKIIWNRNSQSSLNPITQLLGDNELAVVVLEEIFLSHLSILNSTYNDHDITISSNLDFNYDQMSFDDLSLLAETSHQFVYAIQDYISNELASNINFNYQLNFLTYLIALTNSLVLLNTTVIVFVIPSILFILVFLYFSTEYLASKRQKILQFYQTKGASVWQLIRCITTEYFITYSISLVFGLSLSIPFTRLFFQNSNLTSLNNISISQNEFFSSLNYLNVLWVFLLLFTLSLLFFIRNIMTIIKLRKDQDVEFETIDIPFWKRIFLDIILFVIGLCSILIEKALSVSFHHDFITQFTIYFIGLLLLISGLFLFLLRILPQQLTTLGVKTCDFFKGVFPLSFRLIKFKKQTTARNIVVFSFCISYLLLLSQSFGLLNQYSTEKVYFQLGADARINLDSQSNLTLLTEKLSSIQYTVVKKVKLENYLTGDSLSLLIIDSESYTKITYLKDYLLSNELLDAIDKLSTNMTVLTSIATANFHSWSIGYNYSITLSFRSTDRLSLTIVDHFYNWPFFIDNVVDSNDIPFIIGEKTSQTLVKDETSMKTFLLLDFQDNDYTQMIDFLESNVITSHEKLITIEDSYDSFWNDEPYLFTIDIFSIINFYIIILLYLTILVIVVIITLSNQRRELGLFIALGINSKQIFTLSFIEQFIIFLSSLVSAFIIGIPCSIFFLNQIRNNLSINITRISIYPIIGFLYFGLITINLLVIIINSVISSKRKTGFYIQELILQIESDD